MIHTQYTIDGAVARSIEYNEIVTVVLPTRSDLDQASFSILADTLLYDLHENTTYYSDNKEVRELWGTDSDGNTWRVHITHIA